MRLGNRRGEVITVSLIAIAILSGLIGLWFGGTKYAKVVGLGTGTDTKTHQVTTTKVEMEQGYWLDDNNKKHPIMVPIKRTLEYEGTDEVKMTLWQKIQSLGAGFIILMIAFPGTIGAWGIRTFFKAKANLTQLIKGIEEAKAQMPKESVEILNSNLSKKMDQNVKNQIKKIKGALVQKDALDAGAAGSTVTTNGNGSPVVK